MGFTTTIVTLIWGALAGLLGLHTLANLIGAAFCLHGLLRTRWKRLAHKAATGAVKYADNLRLLVKLALYSLFFAGLLYAGDSFVRHEFRYRYQGPQLYLFAVLATAAALWRCKAMYRRSQVIWRMSHEFDYAQKRQRTKMLQS